MIIVDVIAVLEEMAPPVLQESYDNTGLLTGSQHWNCTGVLCTLDVTEGVIMEAVARNCNLVVAHHPVIFSGLKKLNGKNYVEKTMIAAIKNDIAIYAIHTNLDNVISGVNSKMADKLGLINRSVMAPKPKQLKKLYTYIPAYATDTLKNALFAMGAGKIGNYSECSFSVAGTGTFKGNDLANPVLGKKNIRSTEPEQKIEFLFPGWMESLILKTLRENHPYEEVAYEIISLDNTHPEIGSGLVGELPEAMTEKSFLSYIKKQFNVSVIRHSTLLKRKVKRVGLCGGAGSFLIINALNAKLDFFISADIRYHEFFDANEQLVIADIGHWESEQFTVDLIFTQLRQKFINFAVLKSKVKTNSIQYFV
jgi:dinuclear metal center YbgI/SA1388 family protein